MDLGFGIWRLLDLDLKISNPPPPKLNRPHYLDLKIFKKVGFGLDLGFFKRVDWIWIWIWRLGWIWIWIWTSLDLPIIGRHIGTSFHSVQRVFDLILLTIYWYLKTSPCKSYHYWSAHDYRDWRHPLGTIHPFRVSDPFQQGYTHNVTNWNKYLRFLVVSQHCGFPPSVQQSIFPRFMYLNAQQSILAAIHSLLLSDFSEKIAWSCIPHITWDIFCKQKKTLL